MKSFFCILVFISGFTLCSQLLAYSLCEGQTCTAHFEFQHGGEIETDGAVIRFGNEASLNLGDGGFIVLGEGGYFNGLSLEGLALTSAVNLDAFIYLGHGAKIHFENDGHLNLGDNGNIETVNDLAINIKGASNVTVTGGEGLVINSGSLETVNGDIQLLAGSSASVGMAFYDGFGIKMSSDKITFTGDDIYVGGVINTSENLLVVAGVELNIISDGTVTSGITATKNIGLESAVMNVSAALTSESLTLIQNQQTVVYDSAVQAATVSSASGSLGSAGGGGEEPKVVHIFTVSDVNLNGNQAVVVVADQELEINVEDDSKEQTSTSGSGTFNPYLFLLLLMVSIKTRNTKPS